jgi:hypothetical protein
MSTFALAGGLAAWSIILSIMGWHVLATAAVGLALAIFLLGTIAT